MNTAIIRFLSIATHHLFSADEWSGWEQGANGRSALVRGARKYPFATRAVVQSLSVFELVPELTKDRFTIGWKSDAWCCLLTYQWHELIGEFFDDFDLYQAALLKRIREANERLLTSDDPLKF